VSYVSYLGDWRFSYLFIRFNRGQFYRYLVVLYIMKLLRRKMVDTYKVVEDATHMVKA
jgi:hypothetical protein